MHYVFLTYLASFLVFAFGIRGIIAATSKGGSITDNPLCFYLIIGRVVTAIVTGIFHAVIESNRAHSHAADEDSRSSDN